MRRIKIVAVAALAVGLVGCQSLPDNATILDRIQAGTIELCKYVPTAEVVLELLELEWSGVDKINAVVSTICAALTPPPGARGQSADAPTVSGIEIDGQFVGD